jgi:hypothetical protein
LPLDINTVNVCYKMLTLYFTQKFFIYKTERQKTYDVIWSTVKHFMHVSPPCMCRLFSLPGTEGNPPDMPRDATGGYAENFFPWRGSVIIPEIVQICLNPS